ncbi:MAG: excinuclease ABC subunit UvrA, partial [Chlamydiales bacterium]|nr:excinuclease ABC subunit UvrA [Chlamydiales bacterium]
MKKDQKLDQDIRLQNVRVHNLKSVSVELEPNKLICFTGVSGSGKSSLAFDTVYIEGQRRYVESLSQHVRRFLGELPKPDLDFASGLTPTISIEQKTAGKNPRSTVGTITEIYDYMRVLWARAGLAHCPVSGEPVRPRSQEEIIDAALGKPEGVRLMVLAPYARNKKGEFKDDLETIAKKGFTRVRIDNTFYLLDEEISLDKSTGHDLDIVVDRLQTSGDNKTRLTESLLAALELGEGICILYDIDSKEEELLSTKAYSPKSGLSYPPLDPQDFSFNSPAGMCPECQGLGVTHEFRLDAVIDPKKSIAEDCCSVASSYSTVRYGNIYDNLARIYDFSVYTPWEELSKEAQAIFLKGTPKKWTRMYFVHPETGATWQDTVWFRGVLQEAYLRYQEAKSDKYKHRMERLMHKAVCPACNGARIKPYPAATLFSKRRINDVTNMQIAEALKFFEKVTLTPTEKIIAHELVKEITGRLKFLENVGLEYLQLDRTAPTLSGGESQRVRLASQIGSGLVGVTYILDEPSIGLHARDNKKLITSLKNLRDKGNRVVVVEHDEETIREADEVVDFGPRAGLQGGQIVYKGNVAGLLKCKTSLTGDYLSGRKKISRPTTLRKPEKFLTLTGASHNNLKNVDLSIPLGCFTSITGVSGSGKSSLFLETLFPALSNRLMKTEIVEGKFKEITGLEHIDKVIEIDQSPIGRTPRSNPATYVKLFDEIRNLFAKLPQSKAKGYTSGRFSFNVKEGSCTECHGMGQIKLDMDFLEDSWVDCPVCQGKRFDAETLEVRYKEKNIQDVLEMDVKEAKELFAHIPHIQSKLEMLERVGLDYLKIGQPSTTLSGGEAQRIKLVRELSRPDTGKTLYILDEPTTGLHFHDMNHLVDVLQALVDKGNTVVVIEHNIDLIKTCDWIIEMGPESGDKGGKIIAVGTPDEIAKTDSATGMVLQDTKVVAKATKKQKTIEESQEITVVGAEQNNLKKISAIIPRGKMTICAGPSGSGKSSFAFETVFAEGQRRYVESLSPYIRQFVKQMPKPKVDHIDGLSPSVAIEQRLHAANPRSTVGTMTEVYDYLRILYARIGIPHDPKTGARIQAISKEHVVNRILQYPQGEKLHIMAPIEVKRTESFTDLLDRLQKQGFLRIRLNGTFYELGAGDVPYDPKRKNELFLVVDRLVVDPSMKTRLYEAITTASGIGKQKLWVMQGNKDVFFNLAFAVEETGESYPEITPQTFAFNTQEGMCPDCQGLGFVWGVDFSVLKTVTKMSALELVKLLWGPWQGKYARSLITAVFKKFGINTSDTIEDLPSDKLQILMNGSNDAVTLEVGDIPVRFTWKGVNNALAMLLQLKHDSTSDEEPLPEDWAAALRENECSTCKGSRLNALARHVTIKDASIADVANMSIEDASQFVQQIVLEDKKDLTLQQVHDEIRSRLGFLDSIGLSYLQMSRKAATLSGGEAERVRLARQIGSGLTGLLYVLDEPTIGLHPQDCERLVQALHTLKDLGNTLLIVEHDPQLIKEADHIIEFGPGSGMHGGQVVATGSLDDISKNPKSLTAKYLLNSPLEEMSKKKQKASDSALSIKGAKLHNLKNVSVDIPNGRFSCLTGVSGSGKSSLLEGVLLDGIKTGLATKKAVVETKTYSLSGIDEFKNCIWMDQSPVGHTTRSDVAT